METQHLIDNVNVAVKIVKDMYIITFDPVVDFKKYQSIIDRVWNALG